MTDTPRHAWLPDPLGPQPIPAPIPVPSEPPQPDGGEA